MQAALESSLPACVCLKLSAEHANKTEEQKTRGMQVSADHSHPFLLRRNLYTQRQIVTVKAIIIKKRFIVRFFRAFGNNIVCYQIKCTASQV